MFPLMIVVGLVLWCRFHRPKKAIGSTYESEVLYVGLVIIISIAVIEGVVIWYVPAKGIDVLEAENQRIYEVIESQMISSTKDKSLNQVEQMFLEKQVELYIENQQLIQEKTIGGDEIFLLMIVVGLVLWCRFHRPKKVFGSLYEWVLQTSSLFIGFGIIMSIIVIVGVVICYEPAKEIDVLEAENQRIYKVIESQMSSTKDKSLNQVEQMFLEKQVELYIENQQLIQEKRESNEVHHSLLYWGLFPFTNIQL